MSPVWASGFPKGDNARDLKCLIARTLGGHWCDPLLPCGVGSGWWRACVGFWTDWWPFGGVFLTAVGNMPVEQHKENSVPWRPGVRPAQAFLPEVTLHWASLRRFILGSLSVWLPSLAVQHHVRPGREEEDRAVPGDCQRENQNTEPHRL